MTIKKRVISNLTKCYSIAPLTYKGKEHFLVAAEKVDKCILFDLDGIQEEVIWEGPGGVMTMVQVPGTDGQFLATHKFYSPNDSNDSKIVVVTPHDKGDWRITTLVELPFVHRFDVLECDGRKYLIACTLKSGHEYKDDWSSPGKVYAAQLPDDLSAYSAVNQLPMKIIKDNMLKNHGYFKLEEEGIQTGIISSDDGVFQFFPPKTPEAVWGITKLFDRPASDAVLFDFDEDGEKELAVLSPFHGDKILIYKKKSDVFSLVYEYVKSTEFVHAVYGGVICGRPTLIVGYRKGMRELLAFTYNKKVKNYEVQVIDTDCGPANVYHYIHNGQDKLISTNREIDEVALYTLK